MKAVVVTGTMPDIIKMAPIVWEGDKRKHTVLIIHSGQHTSPELYSQQYDSIGLRKPDWIGYWGVPPTNILKEINPEIVLVHGDTNTCRVFAETAHFENIPVGHVEAGLRTHSREPWPEQTNTRIADACSDLHFAPTEYNKHWLRQEGFSPESIFVTGNTIVDMVKAINPVVERNPNKIWFCVHRTENFMHEDRIKGIVQFAEKLAENYEVHFVDRRNTPMLKLSDRIIRHNTMPYKESLQFMAKCGIVITDSGSIQEEAVTLGLTIMTVRLATDRIESTVHGKNVVGGVTYDMLLESFDWIKDKKFEPDNLYGEGNTSQQIWDILEQKHGQFRRWVDRSY